MISDRLRKQWMNTVDTYVKRAKEHMRGTRKKKNEERKRERTR
jgi:hypothetical protein